MAFDRLKSMVTTAPCLALVDLADPSVRLTVNTDASKLAVGGSILVESEG